MTCVINLTVHSQARTTAIQGPHLPTRPLRTHITSHIPDSLIRNATTLPVFAEKRSAVTYAAAVRGGKYERICPRAREISESLANRRLSCASGAWGG